MELKNILQEFGLADKEVDAYLALLELGPSPVRAISRKSGINRGTAYDMMRKLIDLGVVSFYRKGKQHFVAEPPERLIEAVEDKQTRLQRLKVGITAKLPELKALYVQQGGKPSIRVYEGSKGVKKILDDVLNTVSESEEKEYYVYSSSTAKDREAIYKDFPQFNDKRILSGINVRTIALGDGGGTSGLDKRKSLGGRENRSSSTHELIYAGKVAHIGLDASGSPFGVIVENQGIYETQKLIFENSWQRLK